MSDSGDLFGSFENFDLSSDIVPEKKSGNDGDAKSKASVTSILDDFESFASDASKKSAAKTETTDDPLKTEKVEDTNDFKSVTLSIDLESTQKSKPVSQISAKNQSEPKSGEQKSKGSKGSKESSSFSFDFESSRASAASKKSQASVASTKSKASIKDTPKEKSQGSIALEKSKHSSVAGDFDGSVNMEFSFDSISLDKSKEKSLEAKSRESVSSSKPKSNASEGKSRESILSSSKPKSNASEGKSRESILSTTKELPGQVSKPPEDVKKVAVADDFDISEESDKVPQKSEKAVPPRQKRRPWYEEQPDKPDKDNSDKDAEIRRLQDLVREQRTVIDNQKETIKLLMNEAVSHEEISSLRAALASKSPLLQLVAATPMSEKRATAQLRAENAALRREIDEIETRHLAELKAMRAQFASLSSRQMPTDGCAVCKRRIRELEAELKRLTSQ